MGVKSARKGKPSNTIQKAKNGLEESHSTDSYDRPVTEDEILKAKKEAVIEEHLPPLGLTFIVLFCSGALLVLALRDLLNTGKNIAGSWDEAMLLFTKSTDWFEDAKGWKSTQGGFSAIAHVTTDENNMGGFFVRKLCGAAATTVHLQKILPLLMHTNGSQWVMGHYRPLLLSAVVGNLAIALLYGVYFDDLQSAGVVELPIAILSILAFETLTLVFYLLLSPRGKRGPAIALPAGKQPSSCVSNIVRNTTFVVTSAVAFIAARDLFFPGFIVDLIPRDDIYLEWTNAFLHSPPEGSLEAVDQGLEAPLYIGDKFISQLMALHILINCMYKYVSSVGIRYGSDGSGVPKAKMIWTCQAIGCGLTVFVFRCFTHAAASASLDLRWHLMMLSYETFIFGLHAIF